jgi:hypothetical protein
MFIEDDLREETILDETAEEVEEATLDTTEEGAEEQQDHAEPQGDAQAQTEPKYKVKYNGKEMELPVEDLTTYAQKGMNYDHVHEDLVKTREASKKTQTQLERLTSVLNQFGYAGSPQEIADMLEAQSREIEPEQVRAEREAEEAAELARLEAAEAKKEIERIRIEAVMAQDLSEIRKLDPNIKTLNDLGETFFKLRAAGVSNLEAYQIVAKPKATEKPPANTGKDHLIKTGGGASSGGLVEIPKSEVAVWRDMFPDDSMTKLKERYNRSLKRQGG